MNACRAKASAQDTPMVVVSATNKMRKALREHVVDMLKKC
jgi:hypothetical protein